MLIAILTTVFALTSGILLFRFIISPLIASKIAFRQAFTAEKRYPEDINEKSFSGKYANSRGADAEEMQNSPYETVAITAKDGIKLSGRVYELSPLSPVIICFHGYRGTSVEDFCGIFNYLRSSRFNIIAVDQRHQGHSEGECMSFGIRERYDVLDWIAFAREQYGSETPIWLYGMSMGAATVLMASELLCEGSIRGIIADSAYTSPDKVLFNTMKHHGAPIPKVSYRIVSLGACVFGRFRPGAVTVPNAVKNTKAPILLLHGEKDDCISFGMSRIIFEANPSKIRLYTFSEGEHILSCYSDPVRYRKILGTFLRETGLSTDTSVTTC